MANSKSWLNVFGSAFDSAELDAVAGPIQRNWVGMGAEVTKFEQALSERLGGVEVILVNSGSAALHLAVKSLKLPRGGHLLLPANTWNSCANAVVQSGLVPVFVDCDPATGNITPPLVDDALTAETVGLMVVHYAGLPVDMDAMLAFGLPVIEDAAHAVDSTYKGKWCGSIGEVGIYSFDSVKNIATPDLGAVVTRNSEIAEWVKSVRYSGIAKSGAESSTESTSWWTPRHIEVMPKYSPNDVAAAMGLSQLNRIRSLQSRREELWRTYEERLAANRDLTLPLLELDYVYRHSWFTFFIRVSSKVRDDLARFLLAKGIYTTVRYSPLHVLEIFTPPDGRKIRPLPGSETFADEALNLPLHPRMTSEDVHFVCDLVESFLASSRKNLSG